MHALIAWVDPLQSGYLGESEYNAQNGEVRRNIRRVLLAVGLGFQGLAHRMRAETRALAREAREEIERVRRERERMTPEQIAAYERPAERAARARGEGALYAPDEATIDAARVRLVDAMAAHEAAQNRARALENAIAALTGAGLDRADAGAKYRAASEESRAAGELVTAARAELAALEAARDAAIVVPTAVACVAEAKALAPTLTPAPDAGKALAVFRDAAMIASEHKRKTAAPPRVERRTLVGALAAAEAACTGETFLWATPAERDTLRRAKDAAQAALSAFDGDKRNARRAERESLEQRLRSDIDRATVARDAAFSALESARRSVLAGDTFAHARAGEAVQAARAAQRAADEAMRAGKPSAVLPFVARQASAALPTAADAARTAERDAGIADARLVYDAACATLDAAKAAWRTYCADRAMSGRLMAAKRGEVQRGLDAAANAAAGAAATRGAFAALSLPAEKPRGTQSIRSKPKTDERRAGRLPPGTSLNGSIATLGRF